MRTALALIYASLALVGCGGTSASQPASQDSLPKIGTYVGEWQSGESAGAATVVISAGNQMTATLVRQSGASIVLSGIIDPSTFRVSATVNCHAFENLVIVNDTSNPTDVISVVAHQ